MRGGHLGKSPVKVHILTQYLKLYGNIVGAEILAKGFQNRFKIEYNGPRIAVQYRNLRSVYDQKIQLLEKNKDYL